MIIVVIEVLIFINNVFLYVYLKKNNKTRKYAILELEKKKKELYNGNVITYLIMHTNLTYFKQIFFYIQIKDPCVYC